MLVSHDHLTPFSVSLQRPEERNPRIMSHHVSHRLGRAATAGDRQEADHDEGQEEAAEEVPKEELKWRADIRLSGQAGAVVASGRAAATSAPSYGLANDVTKLMEDLEKARPVPAALPAHPGGRQGGRIRVSRPSGCRAHRAGTTRGGSRALRKVRGRHSASNSAPESPSCSRSDHL